MQRMSGIATLTQQYVKKIEKLSGKNFRYPQNHSQLSIA